MLQEQPSAHPAYEGIAFPVAFLSKSETATSDSFSVSDQASQGRYKKSKWKQGDVSESVGHVNFEWGFPNITSNI